MKLLVDVTSLATSELTGIGVYIKNLVSALRGHPGLEVDGAYYAEKFRLRNMILSHISIPLKPYVHLLSGLNLRGYDVFHGPDFRIPFSRMYSKVVTIHDTVDYEETIVDQERSARNTRRFEHMLFSDNPDSIIAVSHFTREQLAERFPQLEPIISVVYLGCDHVSDEQSTERPPRIVRPPYLLSVGTVERRKNISRAIRAFELVKSKFPDLHFVIVGKNGYRHHETDEVIRQSPYAEHIHRKMFITQSDLHRLYRDAELLLFPSLYEGFGIPILEAMRTGCPVVTSDCGAMKEIAGEAAMLVAPFNPEQMAHAILKVCEDRFLRTALARAGKERSKAFTWKRCAEETIEVYRTSTHVRAGG